VTRKDYVRLAAALASARNEDDDERQRATWWSTVFAVADVLEDDNPRFDRLKFHDAAMGDTL
jgi:hypothetical protein